MELHIFEDKGPFFLSANSLYSEKSQWTEIDIKITYFKMKRTKMKKQVTYIRIKLREKCST